MFLFGLVAAAALGQSALAPEGRPYSLELRAELGFVAPLYHRIQFGADGDELDYIAEGGQDVLFPLFRPTATLQLGRQRFTAVYQPLTLRSTATLGRDHRVEDTVFPADRPIDLRYGFSFWRLSWQGMIVDGPNGRFGLGAGLQIRNADIGFTAVDGERGRAFRDVGPVPLLSLHAERRYDDGFVFGLDAEGFYAPVRILNLRDVDVVGAIADVQARVGLAVRPDMDAWLGLRYLGGGADGTADPYRPGDDGYTSNWLHAAIVTLGTTLR